MQTPSTQAITWAIVALEILKYLGPAAIALAATYITLRHQRRTKRDELSLSSSLRARELVFNHYQKKLDRITAEVENIAKSFSELQVFLDSPGTVDKGPAVSSFLKALTSIVLMAKHDAEEAADELRAYGLEKKYEYELKLVKQAVDKTWEPKGDLKQNLADFRSLLFSFTLVQEAALEARMKNLFSEYLPNHRTLKPHS